jgi:hypothetical protein
VCVCVVSAVLMIKSEDQLFVCVCVIIVSMCEIVIYMPYNECVCL